jgi:hypothetical protein
MSVGEIHGKRSLWNWRKGNRLALGIGLSAVFLYLALRGTNLGQVFQFLKRTHSILATAAVLFLLLSFLIRAWRWRYLLFPMRPVPVMPLFRSTMVGFMGNYLLPLRAGELIRAVSIGQNQKISIAGAIGSIVLERVLDGVILSLTVFLVMVAVELPFWMLKINALLLGTYIAGLLLIALGTYAVGRISG